MKVKKSIVVETMNIYIDLLLDQISKECSNGKKMKVITDKENECKTPGEKIKSKGKGKGKIRGKGEGPIGKPKMN
jgi:hypothetical protein